MATATLKCRVCGEEYEACRSAKHIDGVFRWQDVACSPEHGAIYLGLIRESRSKKCDAVTAEPSNEAHALLDEEYVDEVDEEVVYDESDDTEDLESEDMEDPEIEV